MPDGAYFDRDRIIALLDELGARLQRKGARAEMFVVGGSAMALAYSRERVTKDIDAVFEPKSVIYTEATRMAAEEGLPEDWLNDGVKGLMPDHPDTGAQTHYTSPGISVSIASPQFMFAMKAAAARVEQDTEDLALLARLVGVRTSSQALDMVERFYDRARLTPKAQFILQEMFADNETEPRPGKPANALRVPNEEAPAPGKPKSGLPRPPKV